MAVSTAQNPKLAGARPAASDPGIDGEAFTTAGLTPTTHVRGVWINTAGDLYVDFLGGIDGRTTSTNVKFTVPAGVLLPICITKIYGTTTTATGVVIY